MNILKNNHLPYVHALLAQRQFQAAVAVLEKLTLDYPDFKLYEKKLAECRNLVSKKIASSFDTELPATSKPFVLRPAIVGVTQDKERISQALDLAKSGAVDKSRALLETLYLECGGTSELLAAMAVIDLHLEKYSDALYKAQAILEVDPTFREAYRLAEQSAIELGLFDKANHYFLSQPAVINPSKPRKRGKNPLLAKNLVLAPANGAGNDYRHLLARAEAYREKENFHLKVSIIIPVYNRKKILANTLAALTHQTYPSHLIEIIVVDDGSTDDVMSVIKKYEKSLHIYYVRQTDTGYRLAAARNLGIELSKGDAIIFMDADILPCATDVENYMRVMHVTSEAVLIGHRRYVDVSMLSDDEIVEDLSSATNLPSINPNNDVADQRDAAGASIDWRYPIYEKTNFLINDLWPFTKAAGGNICFSRSLHLRAGLVDEEFTAWGCEDAEHCYRLYNAGAYFIPMMEIESLHQEPLNEIPPISGVEGIESFRSSGHRITKQILSRKCPAPVARQYTVGAKFDVPKVSIYIPAFNAEKYIVDAVQSCLSQNFSDLEVCICDDGSTDGTLAKLEANFSGNPKVRWVSQKNGGIGKATNTAIEMCRGMYIGQLDSDDCLKENAVRACVEILDRKNVDGVYGDCDYIDKDGKYIRDGWCGGEFSREWLATGMIVTPFRMFRRRVWQRISGCNVDIKNAVDLDLWLKIYERADFEHIHEILYSYRWHGENTSIMHRKHQEKNHIKVVRDSLCRTGLGEFWSAESTGNCLNPREFEIIPRPSQPTVRPEDIIILIPTCAKFSEKANAIRKTWAREFATQGYRIIFLQGSQNNNQARMIGDTLFVPCRDDYETLLLKLVLGYEFIYHAFEFKHVYKIDDDCYLNLHRISKDILFQLAGNQYMGGATHPKNGKMNDEWHIGKCSNTKFDQKYKYNISPVEYAKGGYGYFLRKDVLPALFEKAPELRRELSEFVYSYEDVRIAEILCENGVVVKKIDNYTVVLGSPENIEQDATVVFDIKATELYYELSKNYLSSSNNFMV